MSTRYSQDHEWIRLDGDVAVVGITDYAQDALGDVHREVRHPLKVGGDVHRHRDEPQVRSHRLTQRQ